MNSNLPIAYTISGSDSSGGAGLQADLKVFSAFNVHGCSITTAITAQNTAGIDHIMHVPNNLVRAQFNSLISDTSLAVTFDIKICLDISKSIF